MKAFTITMNRRETLLCGLYLVFELWLLPALLTGLNKALGHVWSGAAVNFLYFLLNFLAVITIAHNFLLRSLKDALRRPFPVVWCALLGTAAQYTLTSLLTRLILRIDPSFSNVNDGSILEMMQQEYLLMAIGTVLLVPLVEECLFRGLLFGALGKHYRAAAWVLSVGFFAAVHVMHYIGTQPPLTLLLCFVQYLPSGFCLVWFYTKSGNIFTPILIHTAVNAMGMAATR